MVDECHEFCNGKRNLAAIESFDNAIYRFGFTATPPSKKVGLYSLEGALGPVLEATTTEELIEEDFLTKPVIQVFDIVPDEEEPEGNYRDIYDGFVVHNEYRNGMIKAIVDRILETSEKPRILILTQSLEHTDTLHKLIKGSYKLQGEDEIAIRYKTINKFVSKNKGTILIGTRILQTGVNIEKITHFINARGLKSEIATIQALGRSLRKHDSKTKVFVYDFYDHVKYLKAHAAKRVRSYKAEGHEVERIKCPRQEKK
jgi:superfamily II DNA or RNA helicase